MTTHTWLILLFFFLIAVVIVWVFILDYQALVIVRERLETNMLAAGWAGFSSLSLEEIATRKDINILDMRNIILDKIVSEQTTRDYVIKNLKLFSDGRASANSYIADKARPVDIDVVIYNYNDVGNPYPYTSIVITVRVPFIMGPGGILKIYGEKTVVANYDTFLIQSQKE